MPTTLSLDFSGARAAPVILQSEAAECGLACLAMVASHHGHDVDLPSLRRRFALSITGATLAELSRIAQRLDFAPRGLKVEMSELARLALPAVLHWDFDHFVVLVALRAGRAVIHDPAQGRRVLPLHEVSAHFTGVALELTPAPGFEPKVERRRIAWRRLVGRLPGFAGSLGRVLALTAVIELLAVAAPFFMQGVVDHALAGEDRELLAVLGAGFVAIALFQVGVAALRGWALMVLGTTLNLSLATRLVRRLLELPIAFFERRHLGDIVSRFDSLGAIQRTLTHGFLEAVFDGAMAALTFSVMVFYSPRLALLALAAAALYGVLRSGLHGAQRDASAEQIARAAKQHSHLLETLRGVQCIKLFNGQALRGAAHHDLLVGQFNAGIRVQRLQMLERAISGALFGVENVVVVWLGARLVLDGDLTVGMLLAFVAYKQQFVARAAGLVDKALEFRMLGLHAGRVADIALAEPERRGGNDDAANARALADGAIELRGVSLRYGEAGAPVLDGVDLRIEAGESVAITGPSGCGKTTLAKIMLGLIEPTAGEVLVGGTSLRRIGAAAHRERVAAVMQDDVLFAGSIADNIAFFDAEPDHDRIERCARDAAVHAEIAALPMGYATLVGDMGSALSGGQKQRVLLARALYRRPRLLVLDEATSHLDVARERQVNESIRKLAITRVVIAHRPETIASCDRVIVLGGSRVMPQGTPALAA